MRRNQSAFLCVTVAMFLTIASTEGVSLAQPFSVGFSTCDITPPTGWRRAGGYSEFISTGVHDQLFAKAMIVGQGDVRFALVSCDLCSVPRDLTLRARQSASQRTGIACENIVIVATHTHGGPEYTGPLRDMLHDRAMKENQGIDPREPIDYRSQLVDRWVDVITQADAARRPASLSVVVPQQQGLAFNRRYLMKDVPSH